MQHNLVLKVLNVVCGQCQTWRKCSMFLGSWICFFKCSSKVVRSFKMFLRSFWDRPKPKAIWMWTLECELRSIFQLRNILKSGTRFCWLEHLWGNKIIFKFYYQDMKNTSHSQMKNNWIRFLKIRLKMFLNLANVPQDPSLVLAGNIGYFFRLPYFLSRNLFAGECRRT